MRLKCLILLYVAVQQCIAVMDDDLRPTVDDPWKVMHDPSMEQILKKFLTTHANCSRTDWVCSRECRLQFADRGTGLCHRPLPDDHCFGIPITYNYTFSSNHIISMLPRYEVLSRFPRCWSALGPLMCAVAFRPCSNRSYFELTMSRPGRMELWQVFRKDMCYRAREQCGFAIRNNLWPDFVNCSDTVGANNKPLFSDGSCQMPYKEAPSAMDRHQCLWPLVESVEKHRDAQPLIDDCYLPCRSPLLSSDWLHTGFKMFVMVVSTSVCILTAVCFIYMSLFSQLWLVNLCVFALGHALLSAFLYSALLMTSFFGSFARRAMCTADGELRRTVQSGVMDWCFVESFLLHASWLAGLLWLCAFVVIRLGRPPVRLDHMLLVDGRPAVSARCVLLFVYLLASCTASFTLWLNAPETDGLLGVCYVGLRSTRAAMLIYVPAMGAFVASLLSAAALFVRRRYLAMLELDARDAEMARLEGEPTRKPSDEVGGVSAIAQGSDPKVRRETQPLVASDSDCEESQRVEKKEESNSEVAVLDPDELPRKEMPQSQEIKPLSRLRRVYKRKPDGCGCSAVSLAWTWIVCIGMFVSVVASFVLHLSADTRWNVENDFVQQSIMCSVNESIQKGNYEWLNATGHTDHLITSVKDPLARRRRVGTSSLNAPGCELASSGDARLGVLFFAVVLLPLAPFVIAAILVVAGFCGSGLKGIEKIREHLNPFVIDRSNSENFPRYSSGTCEELGLLPSSSGSVRASAWDGALHDGMPRSGRLCASADCLNRDAEANVSVHSQTLSEPTGLNSPKSRVRRINLLQRSAERRRRQQETSLNSMTHSCHSASDLQRLLTMSDSVSRHSNTPFNSDFRSSYSEDSRGSASSFNLTSASQQRDPVFEAAAVLSAYQTGLVEGHWQERCSRYVDQIKALTETLQAADGEIRRLSGLPPPEIPTPHVPCVATPSSSPLVGLSYLSATNFPLNLRRDVVAAVEKIHGSGRSETAAAATGAPEADDEAPGTSGISSVSNPQRGNIRPEAPPPRHSRKLQQEEKPRSKSEVTVAVECYDEPPDGAKEKSAKDGPSTEQEGMEDWMVEEGDGDSDLFRSDEEDEDEEKMFNAMLEELKMEQQAGGSNTDSSLGEANNNAAESPESSSSNQDNTIESPVAVAGPSSSGTPSVTVAPPSSQSSSENAPPVYLLTSLSAPTSSMQQQRTVRAAAPPAASIPSAAPSGVPRGIPSILRGPPPRVPVLALRQGAPVVMLTEEQQRQLQRLRNQLTERDLLYYSEHFRQLALQQARNRAALFGNSRPPGPARPQQGIRPRPPAPIREEEEEVVMDPFSSESGVGAGSSTESNNRRPPGQGSRGGDSDGQRGPSDGASK